MDPEDVLPRYLAYHRHALLSQRDDRAGDDRGDLSGRDPAGRAARRRRLEAVAEAAASS
ncbi:hypothetical protein GCM10009616_33330 [Microlunatus lacustris]